MGSGEHVEKATAGVGVEVDALVAQDVPAPQEIDEAWLTTNQWIISRVLLDDSFRPALDYLTTGLAGDEVGVQVLQATWASQQKQVEHFEALVSSQLQMRDALRQALVNTAFKEDVSKAMEMTTGQKILSFDLVPDPQQVSADIQEATRRSAQSRLDYVEAALTDAQSKLNTATTAFAKASAEYSAAIAKQFARHVAIDQLRVHVKKNIFYYMQAIWDHEPADQRFFRLYNKKVAWISPGKGFYVPKNIADRTEWISDPYFDPNQPMWNFAAPQGEVFGAVIDEKLRDLVEVADLDSPLGYKGNYIIFPLRESCYLTTFMLSEYIDEYFGVRDPDQFGDTPTDELTDVVAKILDDKNTTDDQKKAAKDAFIARLSEGRPSSDMIIVPTGQLFIEALPGKYPLLEDFKLLHRIEDVRKVRAEVRHAELENLRLAARLVNDEREDPEIQKRILVDKGVTVVSDS